MNLLKGSLILGIMTFFCSVYGQDSLAVSLDSITITASRLETSLTRSVRSVSEINPGQSRLNIPLRSFSEYLITDGVPGVYISNDYNSAQDLRISMRGFGSRSAFGIRGIKLLLDGIPETTADGQGQIDHLTLTDISKIEILRGPSASLYGNASGGAISINSSTYMDSPMLELLSRVGSFGSHSFGVKSAIKKENSGGILSVLYNAAEGYRDHSQSRQYNIAGRWQHNWISTRVKFGLEYTNSPIGQDPGGVNLAQVTDDPHSARDRNVSFDAGEEINRWKTWISMKSELNSNLELNSYLFYSNRNFTGRLPFGNGGLIELGRLYGGHSSRLEWKQPTNRGSNTLLVGYDLAWQDDDRERFFNMEGTKGAPTLAQNEKFNSLGLFIVDRWSTGHWVIEAGLRWDNNNLELVDRFFDNGDNSGDINLKNWSPSLGLNYKISESFYAYASYNQSFETPTLNELSNNPNGDGFNTDLSAQQSAGIEIGIRGAGVGEKFSFDIVGYRINSDNETVPFELQDQPGRSFYRNAGSTKRIGIETALDYNLSPVLTLGLNYSLGSFKFEDYEVDGENLNGNRFPGVPVHFGNINFTYVPDTWRVQIIYDYASSIYADDQNEIRVDPRNRFQFNLSKKLELKKGRLIPMLSLQNIFGTSYYDNIRINAFGARYYEAGPGRTVTFGLTYQMD